MDPSPAAVTALVDGARYDEQALATLVPSMTN
jgi:hypothetical protein